MQRIINILSVDPESGMKSLLVNNAEVKAVRVLLKPGQVSENCVIDAPVLLFVIAGQGKLIVEEETFHLTEGDVTVVLPGKNRHLEADGEEFQLLAVQSHQADKTCGLCALLEDCVSLND